METFGRIQNYERLLAFIEDIFATTPATDADVLQRMIDLVTTARDMEAVDRRPDRKTDVVEPVQLDAPQDAAILGIVATLLARPNEKHNRWILENLKSDPRFHRFFDNPAIRL